MRDTEPIHRVWAGKVVQIVDSNYKLKLQILSYFNIGPFPLFFLYTVEAFEVSLITLIVKK
jgi:hypothetical protein